MARLQDKAILMVGMISDRIGMALLYIVFGPLVRELGLSELQFGVLIAAANITLGFASPYWGRRSQVIGRRPVFVIGLSGYSLGFLGLAIALKAGLVGWLTPWVLFLILLAVRLAYGLFAAATQPAATAYLADITDAGRRTQGMALIGVAAGIGTVLGPIIGGVLSAAGAVFPLYVAAGLAAIAAVLSLVGLREPVRHAASAPAGRMRILDHRIFPYLVGWCLIVLVLTAIQTITVFYLEDHFALTGREPITQATSVAFLVMGVAMVFSQAVVLQLFRIPPAVLLRAGFLLFGVALLVLWAAPNLVVLYLAYTLMGLGFSALIPGLNGAASISVGDHEQGSVAGLLAAAPVLGMVFGPVIGTALYGVDPVLPMALGAAGCVIIAVYFSIGKRRGGG